MTFSVGVDLGGSNLRVALYRDLAAAPPGRAPAPVAERREPVGEARAPAELAARLAAAVAAVCAEAGPAAAAAPVGVGLAAMLDPRPGWVANSPHLGWRDVDFGGLLAARLSGRPVALHNDVDAVTWGEHVLGAGRGARDLLVVFVGTGIGAGVVAAGRLITGARHCAGDVGHTKVAWGDRAQACQCGQTGCIEAYAGGAYLAARARAEVGPGSRHAGHLDEAAANGDARARAILDEVAPLLGLALANAVTLLNPARLILGGTVWSNAPTLRALTLGALRSLCTPPALADLVIADAALGDAAGPIGAALLAG